MARGLAGLRIAILATDGLERGELEQPRSTEHSHVLRPKHGPPGHR
jgi:hypothetical protein